jgi:hypothetical protein
MSEEEISQHLEEPIEQSSQNFMQEPIHYQQIMQQPIHYQQIMQQPVQSFSMSQNIGAPVYQEINGTGGKYPDELCSATMGGTCRFLDGRCKRCKRTLAEASTFYNVPSSHISTSCPNTMDKCHDFQNDVCSKCGTRK